MTERDEEEQNQRGFRVVDKRRFTQEGEARAGVSSAADLPRPQVVPQPAVAAPPASPAMPKPAGPNAAAEAPQHASSNPEHDDPETSVEFLGFVASLATNALAAMGALPEARAQGIPQDMGLAQEYIEILFMLRKKTRGNLSAEEDQAFERLLSDLRVQFVKIAGL